jgi:hypothetical protein
VIDEHMHTLRRDHEQAYLDDASRRLALGVPVANALLDGPIGSSCLEASRHEVGATEAKCVESVVAR